MDKVKRHRARAEEMLAIAAATTDKEARETLLTVAEDYKRRADAREAMSPADRKLVDRNSN
jgi:hypothetical protein